VSTLAQVILYVGGILGALAAILTAVKKLSDGARTWTRILNAIDDKTRELEHNGGGSMKDAMRDIKESQGQMKATQDEMKLAQSQLLTTQGQMLGRLDALERRRFPFGSR
jgi:hypothetical protein